MAAAVLTCDTSVVVAGLSEWHPDHRAARTSLARITWLPAHVVAESVSVLSRLPNGQAMAMPDAIDLVRGLAGGRVRQLAGNRYPTTFETLAVAGLPGGAVYDAVIAATVLEHGATLLTLDRKARRTYAAVGASFELLA